MSKAEVLEALRTLSLEDILEVMDVISQYLRERLLPTPAQPAATLQSPRIPGQDTDQVFIAADFNAPLPDRILNDFLNPL
jgi:hypothetical protein